MDLRSAVSVTSAIEASARASTDAHASNVEEDCR